VDECVPIGCQNISILLNTLKVKNMGFNFLCHSMMYSSTEEAKQLLNLEVDHHVYVS
jgi:hypothetical protein